MSANPLDPASSAPQTVEDLTTRVVELFMAGLWGDAENLLRHDLIRAVERRVREEVQQEIDELHLVQAWTRGESIPIEKCPDWWWAYIAKQSERVNSNATAAVIQNEAAMAFKARAEAAEAEVTRLKDENKLLTATSAVMARTVNDQAWEVTSLLAEAIAARERFKTVVDEVTRLSSRLAQQEKN